MYVSSRRINLCQSVNSELGLIGYDDCLTRNRSRVRFSELVEEHCTRNMLGWPSGLRRCVQVAVSPDAWVRIPLQASIASVA